MDVHSNKEKNKSYVLVFHVSSETPPTARNQWAKLPTRWLPMSQVLDISACQERGRDAYVVRTSMNRTGKHSIPISLEIHVANFVMRRHANPSCSLYERFSVSTEGILSHLTVFPWWHGLQVIQGLRTSDHRFQTHEIFRQECFSEICLSEIMNSLF